MPNTNTVTARQAVNTRQSIERISDICARSGFSRSTFYVMVSRGLWTKPVQIGPRMVGSPPAEADAIICARIAGKSDDEIRTLVVKLEAARREAA
jgi:prophage regulatory protein